MAHICEKCGRRLDTEKVEGKVAVRMVSLWFDKPKEGFQIRVGKIFTVDKSFNMIMIPGFSPTPKAEGDMCIVCYPDHVKTALLKLVEAAEAHARARAELLDQGLDRVRKACDDVLDKMARGEIR